MAKIGNSIIKGVEVNEIINLLNRAYADEWLAYYQYFTEAKVVKGLMKDSAIAEFNQHATDELNHANLVSDRILQLGGTPILSPTEWSKYANCQYITPENFDVVTLLDDAIKGEQCAIETYSKILDFTRDKDIVTYDLVSQILADEVEHEDDLQDLYDDITEFVQEIKGTIK